MRVERDGRRRRVVQNMVVAGIRVVFGLDWKLLVITGGWD